MTKPRSVTLLRALKQSDANVRLQSENLAIGLRQLGVEVHALQPHESTLLDSPFVGFHYNDTASAELIAAAKKSKAAVGTVFCFCSDVYSMETYLDLERYVDFFLTPTEFHQNVLKSGLLRPVYVLPEGIDPVANQEHTDLERQSERTSKRCMWFGYSESFYKSMGSLVPVIAAHVANGSISSFTAILDTVKFDNYFNLSVMDYSLEAFRQLTTASDYCILSHFSLDLTLNSYVKSPNKLITALFSGLIPLCSRTPNYEALLEEFGLQRFLFSSPGELDALLRTLKPEEDYRSVQDSGIQPALKHRLAPAAIAEQFLRLVELFSTESKAAATEAEYDSSVMTRLYRSHRIQLSLPEHLADLVPSVRRAIQRRTSR